MQTYTKEERTVWVPKTTSFQQLPIHGQSYFIYTYPHVRQIIFTKYQKYHFTCKQIECIFGSRKLRSLPLIKEGSQKVVDICSKVWFGASGTWFMDTHNHD